MAFLEKIYRRAVKAGLDDMALMADHSPRHELSKLPLALRNYLTNCGYTDDRGTKHCKITWKYAHSRPNLVNEWRPLTCEQQNFIAQPARFTCMKRKVLGGLSVGAIDSFSKGKGDLLKLFGRFKTTHAKNPEIDKAELVTILAEAILIPSYFFQTYIEWTELDRHTIQGTIRYNDVEARGIFYFNEHSEFLRFETYDKCRFNKGKFEKLNWIAYAWNYQRVNGVAYPLNFMAVWQMPGGAHPYFKGRIDEAVFF